MSEEEKILRTIRYCANDYMKQEDGIQCFEWGDLWVLNEYIENIKQENKQLKLDYELYKDNYVHRNYEVEIRDNTIKQLKEIIEEVRERVVELKKRFKQEEHQGTAYDDDLEYDELLQILDKIKDVK